MQILFVGAHPDDIEIGAGAFVAKAAAQGHEIFVLILSDDANHGAERRREAIESARVLSVPEHNVLFASMRDGFIRADGRTIELVRKILSGRQIDPHLVVTHTQADSHNDHVEASRIALAAFREKVFFHFSIHLSSQVSGFCPRVFIDVKGIHGAAKTNALAAHATQRNRIGRQSLVAYERYLGRLAGLKRAEAFEVTRQYGSESALDETLSFSDSPFHRLWLPAIGEGGLTLMYDRTRKARQAINWSDSHQTVGRDHLRDSFATMWMPTSPLRERPALLKNADAAFRGSTVLLVGGAVSNKVVRQNYNRLRGAIWVVEYELPRTEPAFLLNRLTGRRVTPQISAAGSLEYDVGVVGILNNPFSATSPAKILCAAGATGLATRIGLDFLASPQSYPALWAAWAGSTQVAFLVTSVDRDLEIIDAS